MREVNPTVYSLSEFKAKVAAKQHFLTAVLNEPKIFLIGNKHDLAVTQKAKKNNHKR